MIDAFLAIVSVWFVFVLLLVAYVWVKDILLDPHRHKRPHP